MSETDIDGRQTAERVLDSFDLQRFSFQDLLFTGRKRGRDYSRTSYLKDSVAIPPMAEMYWKLAGRIYDCVRIVR